MYGGCHFHASVLYQFFFLNLQRNFDYHNFPLLKKTKLFVPVMRYFTYKSCITIRDP